MDGIKHDLTAKELSGEDAPGLHWGRLSETSTHRKGCKMNKKNVTRNGDEPVTCRTGRDLRC